MARALRLSVHELVDFLLRTGDIDTRVFNRASMSEGTKIHLQYQRKQSGMYTAEYALSHTFLIDDFAITLQGIADGVIRYGDRYVIDEIKSTVIDVKTFFTENEQWHLGQAKCYALMFALQNDLEEIGVRLTYIHQTDDDQFINDYHFSRQQLQDDIDALLRRYLNFYQFIYARTIERNQTADQLTFPFTSFRHGQEKLARYTYAIVASGGRLYVEAPTGIGKTMSTLYPAMRGFASSNLDKVFYLTAKTSGRETADKTMRLLKNNGLKASVITLTAKDKICFNKGAGCNPDECPFAVGYYSKLPDVINAAIRETTDFSPETIIKYAVDHQMCPFELELDLSLFADVIICDYNYVFDPVVYLKRFFDNDDKNYFALVDEAHNLAERAREMYSSIISQAKFDAMKKELRKVKSKRIKTLIRRLGKNLSELVESCSSDQETIMPTMPMPLFNLLTDFVPAAQELLKEQKDHQLPALLEFFFEVNRFVKLYDLYDDNFVLYFEPNSEKGYEIHLYNLDPSSFIDRTLNQLRGSVIFSATLSPIEYYVTMLGGNSQSPILKLANPFPADNRELLIAPKVATTYNKRNQTRGEVADYLEAFIENKVGNYLVFFPSYKYLNDVKPYLEELALKHNFSLIVQAPEMIDAERSDFLDAFVHNPGRTLVGLAVLGGTFSEGIDLSADRLIGVAVIGVGLPQINYQRDLIRSHFDNKSSNGFDFAYVNPGMNRVFQAVGRLIRSENDLGVILLLDERFAHRKYQNLYKQDWNNYRTVFSADDVRHVVTQFWEKVNNNK